MQHNSANLCSTHANYSAYQTIQCVHTHSTVQATVCHWEDSASTQIILNLHVDTSLYMVEYEMRYI